MPRQTESNTAYWKTHDLAELLSDPTKVHLPVLHALGGFTAPGQLDLLGLMESTVDSPMGV